MFYPAFAFAGVVRSTVDVFDLHVFTPFFFVAVLLREEVTAFSLQNQFEFLPLPTRLHHVCRNQCCKVRDFDFLSHEAVVIIA